jgi:hypothetical protein
MNTNCSQNYIPGPPWVTSPWSRQILGVVCKWPDTLVVNPRPPVNTVTGRGPQSLGPRHIAIPPNSHPEGRSRQNPYSLRRVDDGYTLEDTSDGRVESGYYQPTQICLWGGWESSEYRWKVHSRNLTTRPEAHHQGGWKTSWCTNPGSGGWMFFLVSVRKSVYVYYY